MSFEATSIFEKRRLEDSVVDASTRYMTDVTASKGRVSFVTKMKKAMQSSLKRLRFEGFQPSEDIEVFQAGVKHELQPPFKRSFSLHCADLFLVGSLDVVSNLQAKQSLEPVVLAAVVFGRRVATKAYMDTVHALKSLDNLTKLESAALPPSVKFTALYTRQPKFFHMTPNFKSAHKNTAVLITTACTMPSSQWLIVDDDELALEDFEPKLKKRLMRLDDLASLREFNHFCTNHALVNRARSSSGKFLPFKQ